MADVNDDIMIFETEDGEEQRVQYIDSLFYNGDEYAVLADLPDGVDSIDDIEEDDLEIFFMKIVPAEGDDVEYVPVDDDDLSDRLYAIVNQAFDEEEDEEDQ
ncbi:MAG: DUF1292 domain-containing protein [Clostridia bacterium]|nr:DUF1292 domain-containing protein [Clostridia bacterium]